MKTLLNFWLKRILVLFLSIGFLSGADMCYDPPQTTSTIPLITCSGPLDIGCTTTTPIRNISSSTITNTTVIHAFEGLNFDLGNKIGIDGVEKTVNLDGDQAEFSGTLNNYTNFNDFVDFSIFDKGVVYRSGDYAPSSSTSTADQHTIYIYNAVSMSFSAEKYLAQYTKDGTVYNTRLYPCGQKLVSITPQNQSITEGDGGATAANFTVTLSSTPTVNKLYVDYTITPQTATQNTDYSAPSYSGTLTFNKNTPTLSQTINTSVIGDDINESNETYVVSLTSLSQAASENFIIDESFQNGTVTIIEDDNVSGGVTPPISSAYANVDVVNGYSGSGGTYNSWITTKVSAQPNIQLNAVYLGNNANNIPQTYTPSGNAQQAASITILYKLADMSNGATCTDAPTVNLYQTDNNGNIVYSGGKPVPATAIIDPGEVNATSTTFTMQYLPAGMTAPLAKKDVRVKYKAVDFNQLIIDSGITCAQKSSTGGVVEGIPSCLIAQPNDNAENQNKAIQNYTTIFGQTAYDNCYTSNGQPCAASNGGIGAAPYDHEYGCFECSIGAMPYTCSKDNFAIRPNQFAINSTDTDFPNLLRSAEDYNLTVYAYDYGVTSGTNGSDDYNITSATSIFDLNTTKYNKNGDVNASMYGTAVWSAYDFNMSNGISWSSATAGSEVAGTKFDDVGKINLQVIDDNWAAVDINNLNDPTPHNCTANGAYICGNKDVTYIPHHFDFADLNVTNNNGNPGIFTYIANEVSQMAGRIHTRMRALNADGNVTKNFAAFPMWENNVTVVPVVTTSKYIYTDANETNITNLSINFGNGEKTIAWNENNNSQYLRFNFQRDVNRTVNPFDVNGSDLNITISSPYIDPADGDTANINGTRLGTVQPADGNATFLYGRTHAARQRYEGNTGTANIYFESFCFGGGCNKTLLPNGVNSNRTDDVRWYWNQNHNIASDGNVSIVVQKGGTNAASDIVDASDNPTGNPSVTTIGYDGSKGYPYKTTMENNAPNWLIQNEYNPSATTNEFQVEFDRAGDWTGEHETNTTTKSIGGVKTNRRTMW